MFKGEPISRCYVTFLEVEISSPEAGMLPQEERPGGLGHYTNRESASLHIFNMTVFFPVSLRAVLKYRSFVDMLAKKAEAEIILVQNFTSSFIQCSKWFPH